MARYRAVGLFALISLLMSLAPAGLAAADDPDYPYKGTVILSASAATVTGGNTVDLTISVAEPVDTDTTVSLASSPTSAFTNLPSSVVIPSGYSSVVITVTTATVSTTVNATVAASATNYTTGTCGVTITP